MNISANDLLLAGFRKHQSGSWRDACTDYRRSLALQPSHPEALHLTGALERQHDHSAAALSWMRRAIDVAPHVADFHANLADVLMRSGRLDEFDSDLMTVWNSQEYRDLRRHILAGQVDALPLICQKCVVYSGKMIGA